MSIFIALLSLWNNAIAQSDNTINLQKVLTDVLSSKDAKSAGITGIPLAFQCNGVNKDQPVILAVGRIGKEPDAQDLPKAAIYQIGSETKSFIAVIALQLEAEGYFGKNGLDSTIGEVLHNPTPTTARPWNESWNKITLRQLLNHTSGMPDYGGKEFDGTYLKNPYHQFSAYDLIKSVVNKQPDFQPGHGWKYSNTNYIIMGKIISQVSKTSVKQQINSRIINKLGLTHTYYIENIESHELNPLQKKLLMSGYAFDDMLKNSNNPIHNGTDVMPFSLSWTNAAGGIISDTTDVSTYLKALFSDKAYGGLLERKQLVELKYLVATESSNQHKAGEHISDVDKLIPRGYGLGIIKLFAQLSGGNNITYYSHKGDTLGFHSSWIYQENRQAYATYALNSRDPGIKSVNSVIESAILTKISNECIAK